MGQNPSSLPYLGKFSTLAALNATHPAASLSLPYAAMTGDQGLVLFNGTSWATMGVPGGGRLVDIQIFTAASSLYTPNPRVVSAKGTILVLMVGDGGGGAGATWSSAGSAGGGGGGGGVALVQFNYPANFDSGTATVAIGQGGVGGTPGTAGTSGAGSVWTWTADTGGQDIACAGGHGGALSVDGKPINAGGAGGTAALNLGGTLTFQSLFALTGGAGQAGLVIGGWAMGGAGGANYLSGGGGQSTPTQSTGAGRVGTNYGGGGGGSVNLTAATASGGNGAPGICIVTEYA